MQCFLCCWICYIIRAMLKNVCCVIDLWDLSLFTGNKPPGLVPNKFLYMSQDLVRLAKYFNVPLQSPSDPADAMFRKGTSFPVSPLVCATLHQITLGSVSSLHRSREFHFAFCVLLSGSLSAMRFVAAVQEREKGGDQQVERVSRELWRRIWSEDKDITEPASLAEVPFSADCLCLKLLTSFFFSFTVWENVFFLYIGSKESRFDWKRDWRSAEFVHLKEDQRQAEKLLRGCTGIWGQFPSVLLVFSKKTVNKVLIPVSS